MCVNNNITTITAVFLVGARGTPEKIKLYFREKRNTIVKFPKIVNRIYETSRVILIVIAYKYTLCAVANLISIVVYCLLPINV